MPAQIIGSAQTALNVYQALYGMAPANALYTNYTTIVGASGASSFASQMAASFAATSSASLATTVLTNMGINTSVLNTALTQMFDGYGVAARGQIILNLTNLLSNLEGDATYGAAAVSWNNQTLSNFTYSSNTANTTSGTVSASAGQTFTLTTSADVLTSNNVTAANRTSGGDDTFYATADGTLTSADIIDAGAGNDTILAGATAAAQTLAPILTSVETLTITATPTNQKTLTFDATNVTGLTTLNIKNAGAVSHGAAGELETISLSNLAKTTTVGIIGGTAITGTIAGANFTGSVITPTFTGAAAADTQKVAISTKGIVGYLTLATAETVEITATGTGTSGANTIGTLDAQAVKTLNIKGTGDLTISASDLAAAPTIDASSTTGVIAFTGETNATTTTFKGGSGNTTVSTASTGVVNVTTGAGNDVVDFLTAANTATVSTGAGNDEVRVGAQAQVTAADSIDGGDGIDTITVSDATINGTTKTALLTGIKNFEVVKTSAVAEVAVDFNALSSWDIVNIGSASTASAAASTTSGVAGIAAVAATMENPDILWISGSRTGQVGSKITGTNAVDTAGAGGDALTITPKVDNGANAATVKFIGAITMTGGAGGAGSAQAAAEADVGGAGGIALNASTVEVLNLEISGTNATGTAADTVTFTGGAGGAKGTGGTAGAAGSTVVVGTNATINLTSTLTGSTATVNNNVDLGTVVGTNVTINGSNFAGNITVTAASGNVTINGGAGKDTLNGGSGIDTINGGAGADTLDGKAGADIYTGGTGRDSFAISNGGTTASTFDTISDFGKVSTALTATQVATLSTTNAFGVSIAAATTLGGDATDELIFAATATLATAASGTDVSGASSNAGKTINAAISAKGVVTVTGADAALVDTLSEWVAVANAMAGTNGNVAVFEFGGSTYVFQQTANAVATDTLVQLIGVTGVTGAVVVGSSVAAAAGDIFVA